MVSPLSVGKTSRVINHTNIIYFLLQKRSPLSISPRSPRQCSQYRSVFSLSVASLLTYFCLLLFPLCYNFLLILFFNFSFFHYLFTEQRNRYKFYTLVIFFFFSFVVTKVLFKVPFLKSINLKNAPTGLSNRIQNSFILILNLFLWKNGDKIKNEFVFFKRKAGS